ncbi:MAG TPA: DUF4136 domain-containing protein [Gemmatimonadales bacterium]
MMRLISGLVLLLVACGGGIAVNTDYDPLASPRMESFKAWSWLQHPGGPDTRPDTVVATEVAPAIERTLTALGYRKDDANPEFRVGWHALRDQAVDVTTVNAYYGYAYGRWFPGGGVAYSRGFRTEYEPGTLVLDVADARTNELIWRGIARQVFGKNDATEQSRLLNEAITRLFAQFPPSRPNN